MFRMLRVLLIALLALSAPAALQAVQYVGEVQAVKGTVEIQKPAKDVWFRAVNGMPVEAKDRIRTSKNSSCNLELDDGSLMFVDENTEATIEFIELTGEKHSSSISLWFGKLLNNIKKTPSTKMKIKCPTAVISVRGTEFAVIASSGDANVGVFDGEVAVGSSGGEEKTGEELDYEAEEKLKHEVSLKADEETTVAEGEPPLEPTKLQAVMLKQKERLNGLRDRVKKLREKLKRVKPEELQETRRMILERAMNLKEKRDELRDKMKGIRKQLRGIK
ncbi:MAG: FecR domain-containing protein [Endomicrobiales bacterium]|nr:FecR domain-containing protein [Endomicrobiales bacterium]